MSEPLPNSTGIFRFTREELMDKCQAAEAALAAATVRAKTLELQLTAWKGDFDMMTESRDAATAALQAMGCELRDGRWMQECDRCDGSGMILALPMDKTMSPC